MLGYNNFSFYKRDLFKERPALNGYITVAYVVEVLSPNRIMICFNIGGINKCINVKINGYYCDVDNGNIGEITKKRIELAKHELQKKIENRLVKVQFKNNYELKWIKCVEQDQTDDDIVQFMIDNRYAFPVGTDGIPYFWFTK